MRQIVCLVALLFGFGGAISSQNPFDFLKDTPSTPKRPLERSEETAALASFHREMTTTSDALPIDPPVGNVVVVDGVTFPKTDAGIQSAINSVPGGGTVFLPEGVYTILGTITISKSVNIIGAGWGTILQVGAVSAMTDIFLLRPQTSNVVQGLRFQDFYITPAAGTPGRYGFDIDGTNSGTSNIVIDHVRVDTLGNYAISVTNANALSTGTPFATTIRDCLIEGGVSFINGGDNINLQNNILTGPRNIAIGLSSLVVSDGSAHGFMLYNNNITVAGGIVVTNAWQGSIDSNNIEAVASSTEANNALIDIQGTSSGVIENLKITRNYIGANSLFVADSVRVDRATATIISDNLVDRGNGVSYRLTSNADRTQITRNRQEPSGELITTWLSDLGTNTQIDYIHPNSGIRTLTGSPALALGRNTSSAADFAWNTVQARASNSAVWGWSPADPTSTGLDTGLSRISPGVIAVGNGIATDFSGALKASLYLDANGIPLPRSVATGTASLGTSAIPPNSCAGVVSVSASGVSSSDVVEWSFSGDPAGVPGYGAGSSGPLSILPFATGGNVNFRVCNLGPSTVFPGPVSLNWKVTR